jgi:hypothetical protein
MWIRLEMATDICQQIWDFRVYPAALDLGTLLSLSLKAHAEFPAFRTRISR